MYVKTHGKMRPFLMHVSLQSEVNDLENLAELLATALETIEGKISKPSFETWLKSTEAKSFQNDTIVIAAPNEFARDWLENSYSELISDTLYEVAGTALKPKFIIPETEVEETAPEVKQKPKNQ